MAPGRHKRDRRNYESSMQSQRDRHSNYQGMQPGLEPTQHCNRCVMMGTIRDCDYLEQCRRSRDGKGTCTPCRKDMGQCFNSNGHRPQQERVQNASSTARQESKGAIQSGGGRQAQPRDRSATGALRESMKSMERSSQHGDNNGDRFRRRGARPRSRSPIRPKENRLGSEHRERDYDRHDQPAQGAGEKHPRAKHDKADKPCWFFGSGKCRNGDQCPFKHIGPTPGDRRHDTTDDSTAIEEADSRDERRTTAEASIKPEAASTSEASTRDGFKETLLRHGLSLGAADDVIRNLNPAAFISVRDSSDSANCMQEQHDDSARPLRTIQPAQSMQHQQESRPHESMPTHQDMPFPNYMMPQPHMAPGQYMPLPNDEMQQPFIASEQRMTPQQYMAHQQYVPPEQDMMPQQHFAQHHSFTPQLNGEAQSSNGLGLLPNQQLHRVSPLGLRDQDEDDLAPKLIKREDDDDAWAVNE